MTIDVYALLRVIVFNIIVLCRKIERHRYFFILTRIKLFFKIIFFI